MESLYTKYRPQTFADVVGQGHVVATLERAVLEGRTGHAYLFCGPRGTGKTTMARLLAKALLCEQGPGHLPDGSCEQCQLVAAGEHPDVYELDAASNTGVDNVREEIISRVDYAPVLGSRKIYIIDEVHMLTTAAFNALLKTLEEPPSHVVFVLCTTDPQKILETILSRVQRFDFHAISNDDVLARLRYVCEQEGFVYEPRALDLIVRHAQGGMRDALTKLEQLATGGSGTISLEAAQELLGEVAASRLADVSMALARRAVPELFAAVAEFASAGRDLLQVMAELAARLRDVYVVAAVGARPGIVTAPEAELGRLNEEAQAWGAPDRLSRALAVLSEASSEMRLATNQRLVLELAFTRLARPEGDVTLDALAERVAVLERRVAELEAGAASGRPIVVSEAPAASAQPAAPTSVAPVTQAQTQPAPPVAQADGQSQTRRDPVKQTQPSPVAPQRDVATQPAGPQTPPQRETVQQVPQMPERQQAPAPAPQPQQRQTQTPHAPAAQLQPQPAPVPAAAPQAEQPATPTIVDEGEQQRRWKLVCDDLLATAPARGSLLLQSSIASDDGSSLLVNLPKGSGFAVRMLDRADVRALIDPIVTRHFGRRKLVFAEGSPAASYLSQREAPAAVSSVVAAPAPQPAPVPAPQPAPAPAPQPAPVAPAAAQPQAPATPSYPMPWEPAPEPVPVEASPAAYDEVVPYDDADAFGDYQGEEDLPPLDIPGQPMAAEQTHTLQQPPQPAPVPQPAPAPQPAPPKPAPGPKPESAPQPAADATQAIEPATPAQAKEDTAKKKPQSEEEAQLMALLTEVFGEGVTIK